MVKTHHAFAALLGLGIAACATPPDPAEVHQAAITIDALADIVLPETSPLYLGGDGRSTVSLEPRKGT